jgi:hypothetical protein
MLLFAVKDWSLCVIEGELTILGINVQFHEDKYTDAVNTMIQYIRQVNYSAFFCLGGWLAGWLSVCLSVCFSVCLSVCLSGRPSFRLSVCLSVCLSVFLSVFVLLFERKLNYCEKTYNVQKHREAPKVTRYVHPPWVQWINNGLMYQLLIINI